MYKVPREIMKADAPDQKRKTSKREKRTQELRRNYQKPQDELRAVQQLHLCSSWKFVKQNRKTLYFQVEALHSGAHQKAKLISEQLKLKLQRKMLVRQFIHSVISLPEQVNVSYSKVNHQIPDKLQVFFLNNFNLRLMFQVHFVMEKVHQSHKINGYSTPK